MSFSLSQWWHDFIDHLFKHPQAEQVAHPAIAAVAVAAQPEPAKVTIPDTDRQLDPITAAYLGVSQKTSDILDGRVANAPVSGNAPSSLGPLDSFVAPYQHGRWTFQPNVAIAVPIKAPAGPYHIQCSGTGGVPGGDTSVRVAVTVKDANGNVVGSGDDNTYASFTSDGGIYTLDMVAPGATVEDITLAPGLA